MTTEWVCPRCRARHAKTFTYGAVQGRHLGMVARETFHPDASCTCGLTVPGTEILAGLHDVPPVVIPAVVRCIMASIANGLFWGGLTSMYASPSTSVIVGLVFAGLCWLVYFSSTTQDYVWR